MAKRFDICTPRKNGDKTYWNKIGTAWQNDKGGIQLVFEALPLPDAEGRCVANLFEPKSRDAVQQARQSFPDAQSIDDDMVPF
jgi:hypothetical protein